jgi:ankyrin repeat protein
MLPPTHPPAVSQHDIITETGFDPVEGNYSVFGLKAGDRSILAGQFQKCEVTRVIIAGFGYEYSVLQTTLDACLVNMPSGVDVIVVSDACCPCDFVPGMDQVADDELLSEPGVRIVSSYDVPEGDDNDDDESMRPRDVMWRTDLHRWAADCTDHGCRELKRLSELDTRRFSPFALDCFGNSPLIVAAQCRNTAGVQTLLVMLSHSTAAAASSPDAKHGQKPSMSSHQQYQQQQQRHRHHHHHDNHQQQQHRQLQQQPHHHANTFASRVRRKARLLAHVNHQGLHGMTALMWAASLHDVKSVTALLRHGALPTKGLSVGRQNSMIFATSMNLSNQAFAVVRELVKHCSPTQAADLFTAKDSRGWTAFHFASLNGLLGDLDMSVFYPDADDSATSAAKTEGRDGPSHAGASAAVRSAAPTTSAPAAAAPAAAAAAADAAAAAAAATAAAAAATAGAGGKTGRDGRGFGAGSGTLPRDASFALTSPTALMGPRSRSRSPPGSPLSPSAAATEATTMTTATTTTTTTVTPMTATDADVGRPAAFGPKTSHNNLVLAVPEKEMHTPEAVNLQGAAGDTAVTAAAADGADRDRQKVEIDDADGSERRPDAAEEGWLRVKDHTLHISSAPKPVVEPFEVRVHGNGAGGWCGSSASR